MGGESKEATAHDVDRGAGGTEMCWCAYEYICINGVQMRNELREKKQEAESKHMQNR